MAGPAQEQALPLLASANNHGDLAVKLSSLKQVRDILLSAEPSHAAELFPYLVELQTSPETLVRKYLLEVIDVIGAKSMEHLSILLPILLTFLKDNNSTVAKQSIIIGTKIFCRVLEDLSLQFQRRGIVERWLEELWMWMVKFKDAVFSIIFEGFRRRKEKGKGQGRSCLARRLLVRWYDAPQKAASFSINARAFHT